MCNFQRKQNDRQSTLYYFNTAKAFCCFSCRKCIQKLFTL
ncbi:hypothetical protein FAEPRAM212_00781 [Faecalibacterium prausnitzii M21/2]|uniref:Uncharacterized protein n=1 Tax=Faecalibacterium prausnitzii M21/2 TaxID=411485 RepID=A8S8J1_9FIRM|nr:hypothetical protein FAEPRAM212_00781 [Faecalibacterium prausnitzii M21/2]